MMTINVSIRLHGCERDPEDLIAIPHDDHVSAAIGEAGIRPEFGNDLQRMVTRCLVIDEVCSRLVVDPSTVVNNEIISCHAPPAPECPRQ
ncbi:MAG TPA: hypothetical protein VHT74_30265 [Acetobacteraceae bacterium]|jgi:hypothetical protein|nr:hypothetical protein [Acetobacteraceae bacterium]